MRNTLALTGMLFVLIGFSQTTTIAQTEKPSPTPQEPLPPVIGKMKAKEAAERLDQFGEKEEADEVKKALQKSAANADAELATVLASKLEPWECTSHAFGFVGNAQTASGTFLDIVDARSIDADAALKGANVVIAVDAIRTYDYPGKGLHQILFTFHAQHQAGDKIEELDFSQKYRANEGGDVGLVSVPIFRNLKVGDDGIGFKGYTVNVENNDDKKILDFLENPTFKKGMELGSTINPLVPIISEFAVGITKAFANRHKNLPVQDFDMGLDFSSVPTKAKLKEGGYAAVQVCDASAWNWSNWVYNKLTGTIVSKANQSQGVPNNYVMFSITRLP
jgi:hypothetical protein